MTPAQKLEVMRSLIRQAYELKAAALKARHPSSPTRRSRPKRGGSWPVDFPDLIRLFHRAARTTGNPLFVTGGVATGVYGEPRFTRDINVVIALEPSEGGRLRDAFDPADFYVPPAETLLEESTRPTSTERRWTTGLSAADFSASSARPRSTTSDTGYSSSHRPAGRARLRNPHVARDVA